MRLRTISELSGPERLLLQQLRLADWAAQGEPDDAPAAHAPSIVDESETAARLRLRSDIQLASWQADARDAWIGAGGRGTIKVVTGAGKTLVALAIAEALQATDADLKVVVIVPTIVLMNQWVEALTRQTTLPEGSVGRLYGGRHDDFSNNRRVVVTVLATARKELPEVVRRARVGEHLLLIADECHRVGAPEMSAVLRTESRYRLGLSATPEREDAGSPIGTFEDSVVGSELGKIVYEMSFAEAVRLNVLPPFDIYHYGLSLSPNEARRYEALSRSITDARKELFALSAAARQAGGGSQLMAWARRVSSRGGSSIATAAGRFVNDTTRRKQLLYRAKSRLDATTALVTEAIQARSDARVIIFHESIDEVVVLFDELRNRGVPVVMEHSDLPQELRENSLELFRSGLAQVIVSARSLIEGFNVPEADLGIVVASSSSPRQRIQSIGRVLRKYRGQVGEEKTSRVCVLYIRDSVDDRIYEREDWDRLVGVGRNRFLLWDPPGTPIGVEGPPRVALPKEEEIRLEQLKAGDVYPGRYEGSEFTVDGTRNVKSLDGRVALNPQDVPALVRAVKGQFGRFRVTPRHNVILVRVPIDEDSWNTVYAGHLMQEFRFDAAQWLVDVDIGSLAPGDQYPGPSKAIQELRYRQRGGGTLARRMRGREMFARGPNADHLIAAVQAVRGTDQVTRIVVNELGHAFWWDTGRPRFLVALSGPLEFPAEAEQ